jgi:hypothetical protein
LQAGVVGVTTAQDVMDLMEKRVKSRFSHRRLLVTLPSHFEVSGGCLMAMVVYSVASAQNPVGYGHLSKPKQRRVKRSTILGHGALGLQVTPVITLPPHFEVIAA